jgi:hypothetical protein
MLIVAGYLQLAPPDRDRFVDAHADRRSWECSSSAATCRFTTSLTHRLRSKPSADQGARE